MDQVITLIIEAATKLGIAFEYIYPKVIMAYWIEGIYYVIALPSYFIGAIVALKYWAIPGAERAEEEWNKLSRDSKENNIPFGILFSLAIILVLGVIAVISLLMIVFSYPYYVKVAFSPEGQFVLDMVKNAAKK